jgi:2-furoyl-CoA dehydrogenase large subunit
MYGNHQMPGIGAIWMAPALRTGIDKLRFVSQDIGGAFGNKICLHPQYVACCLLARKLNRPVQWTEWRTDQHTANAHGNERTFLDIEVPVKSDGTMLGLKSARDRRLRRVPALRAARLHHLGAGHAGLLPLAQHPRRLHAGLHEQVAVSPNRGYSRMQHLWLTERVIDLVAHELELDPVEVRKRNYVRAEEMPYETPNGCVYDSGDYARALDIALELIGYDELDAKRATRVARQAARFRIGSTLDSGTNNFGQSTLLNPELQFSGNNEVATVKLDIFGEIVVTLGTVPQGQGHETTARRSSRTSSASRPTTSPCAPGHDSYWNSHAGFSGTYASQFAVTGPRRGEGRDGQARARDQARRGRRLRRDARRHRARRGAGAPEGERRGGDPVHGHRRDREREQRDPPEDVRDVTLNCRYVYVPPFQLPDKERKFGNLTLTYASQVHVCLVEIDPRRASTRSSTTRPWTTAARASTRRSSRARCTARPRRRSARRRTRSSPTTRRATC